jgi:PAS domain S-box-containing protein
LDCIEKLEAKESILDGISDALMLLDAETYEILDVNRAFLNLYDRNRKDVIGRKCHKITHHLDRPCSTFGHGPCPLEQIVKTGSSFSTQHTHKDREGENLYFEINAYPLMDSKGKVIKIIHSAKNVTAQKKAEKALKERLTRSEHLAALGQLVAEITHEIKNPLMLIGGFARRLFQPVDQETKIKHLTIITEQVARLDKLLTDLREYHLPKANDYKAVNVIEVLRKIYSLAKDECAKKNIRSELILNEDKLIVNWDPDKLEQVLFNVVKNSMEAMGNGGILSIKAESVDEKAEITISDNGCGIPKNHLEKIFECFFTTKNYGTGLGLCISKKYVDTHEGSSLSVKSEEDKGTTIEISIPLLDEL